MKEQKKIPVKKIQRASRILGTGFKVGRNYAKYYTKKIFKKADREELDRDNAEDIYNTLSKLKGGALKIAQMMSMNDALPNAFTEKFALAQYSAPPLSYPLIVKTFKQELGKSPTELFDTFTKSAVNAASIGQVHIAVKNGKKLAVKIQYPGVAESLQSDIKMIKPFALQFMNITKAELNHYAEEVEKMLIMETDYVGELERSVELTEKCSHIDNIKFPVYYPEYSSKRVITMDWLEGTLLDDFVKSNASKEQKNIVGQAIWDFYNYQMHTLKQFHADPHAGNFIILPSGDLGIIDFGAVKKLPESMYKPYFKLVTLDFEKDRNELENIFSELNIITPKDTPEEKKLFSKMFKELIKIVKRPFESEYFDFGKSEILKEMFVLGEKYSKDKSVRKANAARGRRDAIYLNRTFFGMYSILSKLGANIAVDKGEGYVYNEN